MAKEVTFIRKMSSKYKAPSSPQYAQKEITNCRNLKRKLKKTLIFSSLDALSVASAGVFIGSEGSRVLVKHNLKIWLSSSSIRPRKRGSGRVFVAKALSLAARFRHGLIWSVHLGISVWIWHLDSLI